MNDREFEQLLARVVDDGPLSVDERVIEQALAAIPTTAQRGSRAGLLRRFTMRPQLVPALAVTGLLVALGFGAILGFGGLGPSATPTPVPTPTPFCTEATGQVRPFTSSSFQVPLRLDLPNHFESAVDDDRLVLNHCEVPWAITDLSSLLLVRVPPPSTDQLAIIPLDEVRLRGVDGVVEWPTDPEAWFAAEPGVTLGGSAPPIALTAFGRAVETIGLDLDPAARDQGPLLLETADGEIVPLPDRPTSMLLGVATAPSGARMLLVFSAATEDFGHWAGSILTMIESMEPAG